MLSAKREDDRHLPGSKRMIRQVRSHLKGYGLSPVNPIWRQAWQWANEIRRSYLFSENNWPSSTEIATQYVVLLMAQMQSERSLKLPFRSNRMPDSVRATLAAAKNGRRLVIAEDPERASPENLQLAFEGS